MFTSIFFTALFHFSVPFTPDSHKCSKQDAPLLIKPLPFLSNTSFFPRHQALISDKVHLTQLQSHSCTMAPLDSNSNQSRGPNHTNNSVGFRDDPVRSMAAEVVGLA